MRDSWLTWRRTLKGRQDANVLLLIMSLRKLGQLGCVKFVPKPPSNALGRGEPVADGAELPLPESVIVGKEASVEDADAFFAVAVGAFVDASDLADDDEGPRSN